MRIAFKKRGYTVVSVKETGEEIGETKHTDKHKNLDDPKRSPTE